MGNSFGYTVEIKGLNEQRQKFNAFDAIADPELTVAMKQSVSILEREIKPLTPVFMSRLRGSIGSEVWSEGAGSIVGKVGSTLKAEIYPSVMEFGRRSGKAPPPGALDRWVHLVLGIPEKEAPGVAYVIGRKLKARAMPGHFFMKIGFERSKERIMQFFNAARVRITDKLSIGGKA